MGCRLIVRVDIRGVNLYQPRCGIYESRAKYDSRAKQCVAGGLRAHITVDTPPALSSP